MNEHNHPGGLEKLNEMRLLAGLKAISALLEQSNETKWAAWFQGDHDDFIAAQGGINNIGRQLAVIEHILMAFGGLSDFNQLVLLDENANPASGANEKLLNLAEQIWQGARGLQAHLISQVQQR